MRLEFLLLQNRRSKVEQEGETVSICQWPYGSAVRIHLQNANVTAPLAWFRPNTSYRLCVTIEARCSQSRDGSTDAEGGVVKLNWCRRHTRLRRPAPSSANPSWQTTDRFFCAVVSSICGRQRQLLPCPYVLPQGFFLTMVECFMCGSILFIPDLSIFVTFCTKCEAMRSC